MTTRWAAMIVGVALLAAACGRSSATSARTDSPVATSTSEAGVPTTGFAVRAVRVPSPDVEWQIQYEGEIDPEVEVGLFDLDLVETPDEVMRRLSERGVYLLCYFSAGSLEEWRPDATEFPPDLVGEPLDGWPGERWLDIRRLDDLMPIMEARMDLAVARGCDGVDPDNVNAVEADSGFDLEAADQLDYNRRLAAAAHARGLAIALKNDLNQIAELEPDFDLAVNEECLQLGECDLLTPFVTAGKAVLAIEYEGDPRAICAASAGSGRRTLIKKLELDAWVVAC